MIPRFIQDPRCPGTKENGCQFPDCPCEEPPHDVKVLSPAEEILQGIGIMALVAMAITFALFYLVNEVI